MLKLNATRPDKIVEKNVTTGYSVGAEGMALMQALEAGEETVRPSAGTAPDIFVGFSWAHNIVPSIVSRVDAITVPASPGPYTGQLKTNLVAANIMVLRVGDSTVLTEGDATNADEYSVNDTTGVITFNSADAEEAMIVTYRYSPSALELKFEYPEANVNINPAFEIIRSIGVIIRGEVFTDQYDAAIDWASATSVKLGASGIVTTSGSGATITGARITHVPDAANPFLGIEF